MSICDGPPEQVKPCVAVRRRNFIDFAESADLATVVCGMIARLWLDIHWHVRSSLFRTSRTFPEAFGCCARMTWLSIPGPDRTRQDIIGNEWKPALNAFAIAFNGRITPTGN